jgi:hypothetical protein
MNALFQMHSCPIGHLVINSHNAPHSNGWLRSNKEIIMLKNIIKAAALAGTIALGGVAATTGTASAQSGIYIGSGVIAVHFNGGHRFGRHHGHRNRYYNRCSPRKALRKARRNGIRHARIARVNHRGVVVKGRKWGDRVRIGFANNHRCSVRYVRAR